MEASACRNIGKFVSNSVIVSWDIKKIHTHKLERLALEVLKVCKEQSICYDFPLEFNISILEKPKLMKANRRKF